MGLGLELELGQAGLGLGFVWRDLMDGGFSEFKWKMCDWVVTIFFSVMGLREL